MNIKIKPQTKIYDNINIIIQISSDRAFVDWNINDPEIRLMGHMVIDGPEYDAWGTDDNYIYDLILQKLGYKRA